MYWLYRTHINSWNDQEVIAKLVTPAPHLWSENDYGFGFKSPRQNEPYGVELSLTYQVNSQYPHPDNYADGSGFTLNSKRLIDLFRSFDIRFESFPITMIDEQERALPHLDYYIFHSLEGVIDAMDEEKSEWLGDWKIGIPRLVLDEAKFELRPIFKCNHIYVQLMRDDLKQAIRQQGITGFDFLAPQRFRSGSYGSRPDYDD